MNKKEKPDGDDIVKTPCSTARVRRMGLSKRKCINNPPSATSAITTPQTDAKVTYKSLEDSGKSAKIKSLEHAESSNPTTPCSTLSVKKYLGGRPLSSTGCHRYGLTLNKHPRQDLTKKKLEFQSANDMGTNNQKEEECCKNEDNNKKFEGKTNEELIACITEVQNDLKDSEQQNLEGKIKELHDAIDVWKIGFNKALNELQETVDPHADKSELLTQFGIPSRMMEYVDDD